MRRASINSGHLFVPAPFRLYIGGDTGSNSAYFYQSSAAHIGVVGDVSFEGTSTDHCLVFSNRTRAANKQYIRIGAYATPITFNGTGFINMYCLDSSNAGVGFLGFWLMRGTGSDALIGLQVMLESESVTNPNYPISLMGLDSLVGLTNASSVLKTAGTDHTAGMFGLHAKVYGIEGTTTQAGSRVAPLWLDGQLNGSNHSTSAYYDIYATSGGKAFNAFARLQLISGEGAGWTNLLSTNFGEGTNPLVANTVFDETTPSGGIAVDINGTTRYIPYYPAG